MEINNAIKGAKNLEYKVTNYVLWMYLLRLNIFQNKFLEKVIFLIDKTMYVYFSWSILLYEDRYHVNHF